MANIRVSFKQTEDMSDLIRDADNEDLEVLRQEIHRVSIGKPLSYWISYINQICRNLWLEMSLYPHLHSILRNGIESWITNESFYLDMSVGYTQLMNQIGIIQLLFQHFEKYVMKDEDIKSIRLLQISILKEKLVEEDVENLIK